MHRVFLTGCTGEIGCRLTKNLLHAGYEVFGIRGSRNCSISHPRHVCETFDFLDGKPPIGLRDSNSNILIHTAWFTAPNEFWSSDKNESWVNASKRLVDDFVTQGGKYVVVTGSCAEYSWNLAQPLSEDSLELPATIYGKAKLELLNWLRQREIEFLWTRTFFQFGMNEPTGRLIPTMIDNFNNQREFAVRSGGDTRDFVFVEDVAQVLALLVSQNHKGVVNIGTGIETKVSAVSELIAQKLRSTGKLRFESNSDQISYVVSNVNKLEKLIGPFPWTPLEISLEKTIMARRQKAL
jgi:nucleoside-diphosphate-sugar epimerase